MTAPYDDLITAMPLDKLCNDVLNGEVPRDIKKATASLRHSGGYMVGVGIKQPCPSTKATRETMRAQVPYGMSNLSVR